MGEGVAHLADASPVGHERRSRGRSVAPIAGGPAERATEKAPVGAAFEKPRPVRAAGDIDNPETDGLRLLRGFFRQASGGTRGAGAAGRDPGAEAAGRFLRGADGGA